MTSQPSSLIRPNLAAIVLCGGKSSRMGSDKANLQLGSQTMLEHVCETLLNVVQQVVVVAAQGQSVKFSKPGVSVVVDDFPDEGPLGGFLTGLRNLDCKQMAPSAVWLAACDTPLIPASTISKTHDLLQTVEADAAVVTHGDRLNPLIAAYRLSVSEAVERAFQNGERSLTRFLHQLNFVALSSDAVVDDSRLLMNINRPEELTAACKLLEQITKR